MQTWDAEPVMGMTSLTVEVDLESVKAPVNCRAMLEALDELMDAAVSITLVCILLGWGCSFCVPSGFS